MANYRFRVTFEDHDEINRDIEIRPTQTFEEFHYAIHNSIGFDAAKPASFYMSDDNWKKGKEISNRDLKEDEKELVSSLKKSRLCDFIADPHQKIYYIFDFTTSWTFHLELIKINREDELGATYPRCTRFAGDAPKQYGNAGIIPIPVPEDFDLDLEDEETEEEAETLGVEESELPLGEEKDTDFVASTDTAEADDFETAGDEEEGIADTDEV